ncbi:isochorismatase family protein [Microbulbifer sp. 2304DJ12-6]|uniref:isochorismatase family protein n=1 Tax=Microbulbifer sp. 2304DJ12-6 TaxID=3233340 RepID=UPI0039AED159
MIQLKKQKKKLKNILKFQIYNGRSEAMHLTSQWCIAPASRGWTSVPLLRSYKSAPKPGVKFYKVTGHYMDIFIIIDMQEASFSTSDKFDSVGVIDRINRLSKSVRKRNGKVIFIQHDGTEEEGLAPNTPGWEILSSLYMGEDDIIVRKTTNDAFHRTNLTHVLGTLNPARLIISGWATDFCVDTTIRSAVSHDYEVAVVSDCHTLADRPHLSAEKVIEHHNWVWGNMLTTSKNIQVAPASGLYN